MKRLRDLISGKGELGIVQYLMYYFEEVEEMTPSLPFLLFQVRRMTANQQYIDVLKKNKQKKKIKPICTPHMFALFLSVLIKRKIYD